MKFPTPLFAFCGNRVKRNSACLYRTPLRLFPTQERRQRTRYALSFVILMAAMGLLESRRVSAQTAGGSLDVPQTRLAPLGAPTTPVGPSYDAPGQGSYSPSQFDPYAGAPASGFVQPSYTPPTLGSPFGANSGGLFGAPPMTAPQGGFFAPASPAATFGAPGYGGLANQPPPVVDAGNLFSGNAPAGGYGIPQAYGPPQAYGAPQPYEFPSNTYPSGSPSTLFPGGLFGNTQSSTPQFNPYRLIQRGRFRHTYIQDGNGTNDLGINDTDVALAFAIPSFLFSTQPLYIAPSFSLHLWDGPQSTSGADLPGSAFSAFLDFAWQSDPNRIVGADLGVSVGVFSGFKTFDTDSLRVRGKGLGTFRITPASTLKVGVYYYDRVDIKLLPAVGLFWRPNPFTKVDLFFPEPKYSRYLSTVGTNDVWWYVSGEFGGGSWTIERETKGEDQVDINDLRVTLGLEWGESQRMRAGLRTWFCEFGYVGDRQLVYRHNPTDNLSISDTWMFRLGLGY